MNDIEEATRLTIDLARSLIRELQATGTPWEKAFLRAEIDDSVETYKGSIVLADGAQMMDVVAHKAFFAAVREIVPKLRVASANGDRRFCVALLIVDSTFDYEVKYEYIDPGRWALSRRDGSNGVPAGYAA